jgi:hypothetical protein
MVKTYKSAQLKAIHATIENLYAVGAVDDETMRDFDGRRLAPRTIPRRNASRAFRPTAPPAATRAPKSHARWPTTRALPFASIRTAASAAWPPPVD